MMWHLLPAQPISFAALAASLVQTCEGQRSWQRPGIHE
jgi:hypothetical protein